MAALSDYLESGLLSHLFRNSAFSRPANICIALTSGVPVDSDTGSSLPELPSGVQNGLNFVPTNYQRINLGSPATNGDSVWNSVGVDTTTTYSVSGTTHTSGQAYFYPLFLSSSAADTYSTNNGGPGTNTTYTFKEFPSVVFFAPNGQVGMFNSGVSVKSSYPDYEGNGFIRNKNQIVFNTALTEWGWVSGIAIVDHPTVGSGNLLMYAKLTNPRYVYLGDNIRFDVNSLEISLK